MPIKNISSSKIYFKWLFNKIKNGRKVATILLIKPSLQKLIYYISRTFSRAIFAFFSIIFKSKSWYSARPRPTAFAPALR